MIKEFHKSKNLFDLASWIIANGSTYTKDGESYTFDTKQSMFSTPFYFSNTDIVVSISGIIESITAPSPRLHLLHADGTTAKSGALMPSTLKSENVSCAGLRLDWSSTGGTVKISNLMLNTGSTALPYEPYGDTWNTKSYAKIVDTTQQVTSFPVVVRPMENAIPSWTIKGNMVQDGTPTPQNPITPSETGDRTGNLFELTDSSATTNTLKTLVDFGTDVTYDTFTCSCVFDNLEAENGYGAFIDYLMDDGTHQYVALSGMLNVNDDTRFPTNVKVNGNYYNTKRNITFRKIQAYLYTTGYNNFKSGIIKWAFYDSEKKDYEPYGYKLDIKSANTTTPVYLGEVETTRKIKKLVLTGQENWTYESEYTRFYTEMSDFITQGTRRTQFYLSHYQCISDGRPIAEVPNNAAYSGQINDLDKHKIYIKTDAYNTVADFKTYLQQQYANGTPVTIWYILTNETTTTLNEPLRKIGNYADSVLGTNLSVTAHSPTTIDVDTSLKPSEMDLTYTGLKMCGRKKYAHGDSPQILPSAKAESRTSGNITLTCDGNGVYTLVGSPTPNTNLTFNIPPTEIPLSVGGGGNGTLSLFNDSVYNNFDIIFVYQGTQYREAVTYSPNTINKTSTTYGSNSSDIGGKTIISIGVHITGYGNINCTFSPMITNDGQLPSTFQPYCSWQ